MPLNSQNSTSKITQTAHNSNIDNDWFLQKKRMSLDWFPRWRLQCLLHYNSNGSNSPEISKVTIIPVWDFYSP